MKLNAFAASLLLAGVSAAALAGPAAAAPHIEKSAFVSNAQAAAPVQFEV